MLTGVTSVPSTSSSTSFALTPPLHCAAIRGCEIATVAPSAGVTPCTCGGAAASMSPSGNMPPADPESGPAPVSDRPRTWPPGPYAVTRTRNAKPPISAFGRTYSSRAVSAENVGAGGPPTGKSSTLYSTPGEPPLHRTRNRCSGPP